MPLLQQKLALAGEVLQAHGPEHGGAQLLQPLPGARGDPQPGGLAPPEVGLGVDPQRGTSGGQGFGLGVRPSPLPHAQHQIGGLEGLARAGHAQLLQAVRALPDPGGVKEQKAHPAQLQLALHHVPGGPGDLGDDGLFGAQQGVEQAGFSGVDPAGQHGLHPAPHLFTLALPGRQAVQLLADPRQDLPGPVPLLGGQVLLGIVQQYLQPGQQVQKLLLTGRDLLLQGALQQGVAGVDLGPGAGVQQFGQPLAGRQVQLSVQKGPPGELARLGQTSPPGQAQPQHRAGQLPPAVAVQLGRVLSGKTVRPVKGHGHGPVGKVLPQDPAQMKFAGLPVLGRPLGAGKDPIRHLETARPRKADDADPGGPLRRGDGGNTIVDHRKFLL